MATILVSLAVSLVAQTEDVKVSEQLVTSLARQLDADEKQSRIDAEKKLIELGIAILPLLPPIDNSTSAEMKDRLTRIRRELERQAAAESAIASRITAKGTMTLSKFIELVNEQTGNELLDYRNRFGQDDSELEVTLDIEDKPFFEVLDSVLDQVGLTVYNYGGEIRKMALVAKTPGQIDRVGSAGYAGPFRFEATEIFAQRDLRNSDNETLRLRIEALWEPRLLPIVISQPLADFQVKGDDGNEIGLTSTEGTAQIPVQSTVSGINLVLSLNLPDRSITKISSLKGKIMAMVPGKEAEFEFPKLKGARNIIQKRAGITVTLDRVAKNRSLYEVRLRLRLDKASESLQSHLDWAANNVAYLEDKKGNKIDNPNYEQYLEREHEIGFAYLFPLEGDISDYKLVYKSPAAIIQMPIEFELKGIALP